jgi:hypothetical protein
VGLHALKGIDDEARKVGRFTQQPQPYQTPVNQNHVLCVFHGHLTGTGGWHLVSSLVRHVYVHCLYQDETRLSTGTSRR